MVSALVRQDPEAIIIIQSDHGPHVGLGRKGGGSGDVTKWIPTTPEEARNKFGILSAIRLPEPCRSYLDDERSAVNTFAVVFACLDGSEPKLLPHASYFFYDRQFIEIKVD